MIYIGIDPDLVKSGVAYWFKADKQLRVELRSFLGLIEHWQALIEINTEFEVRIEAGWLNKPSNFRTTQNKAIGESIARKVGENHAVGKLIEQVCKEMGIPYKLIRPTRSKVTPKYFTQLTGVQTKNQECIDAGMLVYGI